MDIFDTQHSRLAILSQTTQIGNYRPPLPLDHFYDVIKHCELYHSIESYLYIPNRCTEAQVPGDRLGKCGNFTDLICLRCIYAASIYADPSERCTAAGVAGAVKGNLFSSY